MRTTIEIPDELRARLVAEAARRGERGYSAVVERALRSYFGEAESGTRREIARRLRGSEAGETSVAAERERISELRGNWRTGREK